jgi:hypothetical protein
MAGAADPVLCLGDVESADLARLAARYGMQVEFVASGAPIRSTYWGAPEAGLEGSTLLVRTDTPVHSALHELAHFVCMDPLRRRVLVRDAGGDFAEEDAVCYLQILLADFLAGVGRARMLADMDRWGYTFRLGSAAAWFESDADDAADWLRGFALIDGCVRPTWRCRSELRRRPVTLASRNDPSPRSARA